MRRTREIVGLPVINVATGDQVGWIQDIVFNEETDKVQGILLEGGHLFQTDKGIQRTSIVAVGKDALTVNNESIQELKGTKWSEKVGNHVYTENGDARGTIEDVFIDDSAEKIVGYEISDGLFADLVHGREAVLQQNIMVDGKDILIVDNNTSFRGENEGGTFI